MAHNERMRRFMGQTHAECDCPHPDICTNACLAEEVQKLMKEDQKAKKEFDDFFINFAVWALLIYTAIGITITLLRGFQ